MSWPLKWCDGGAAPASVAAPFAAVAVLRTAGSHDVSQFFNIPGTILNPSTLAAYGFESFSRRRQRSVFAGRRCYGVEEPGHAEDPLVGCGA